MHHELRSDTQAKARELARKITVAHDLDPEIQEELYGHIEDKLLAYKSGEERVSDEDARVRHERIRMAMMAARASSRVSGTQGWCAEGGLAFQADATNARTRQARLICRSGAGCHEDYSETLIQLDIVR